MQTEDTAPAITISPLAGPADAQAFRELNEQWITRLFALEPADREVLGDPQGRIIATGGQVLLARLDGAAAGCVAVVNCGGGIFELSKMAVSPEHRRRGLGRMLVQAAVDHARAAGASTLFLGSNRKLSDAVHLYESAGFRHVTPEEIGHMPYDRADVFMALQLR